MLAAAGCGNEVDLLSPSDGSTSQPTGNGGGGDASGAGGSTGAGQPPKLPRAYPDGPYGYAKGSVIEDYAFIGYPDASISREPVVMQLSDFYNPTGDGTFPAGSPYGEGRPMPRALCIDIGAAWCPGSVDEAEQILPEKYAAYEPCGGQVLFVLEEVTPDTPATLDLLTNWTKKFEVNYPAAIDPTVKLSRHFVHDNYPANLLVDPRTMAIVDVIVGPSTPAFWTEFAEVLGDPACTR
jgi:hypothetical protein